MHDARVPVTVVDEPDDPVAAEVFERLAKGSVGVVNIHRTLANSPEVFAAFIGFAHALRFRTELDPGERELAILRALHVHRGAYEIHQHRRLGAAAGLSDAAMDAACGGAGEGALTDRERAIVAYADAFAANRGIAPGVADGLTAALDNRGVVELSLTLALYVGLAHLTAALDVPAD